MQDVGKSRRKLLQSIGAGSVSLGSAASAAPGPQKEMNAVEVSNPGFFEHFRAITKATNDPEYRAIDDQFTSEGLEPLRNKSKVWKVVEENDERRYVVVTPYMNTDGEKKASIMYTGIDDTSMEYDLAERINAAGYRLENGGSMESLTTKNQSTGLLFYSIPDGLAQSVTLTQADVRIDVKNGSLSTMDKTPPSNPGGCENCVRAKAWLDRCDVDMFCVIGLAGAYFATLGACSTCGLGNVAACSVCVGAILQGGMTVAKCPVVKECNYNYECISDERADTFCPPPE